MSIQDELVRKAFEAYHQGMADLAQARLDRMLADAEIASKAKRWPPIGRASDPPEAITTELECTGIDQYAIEIEQAGRRVRYEAPSVEGVRDLMRMNHDHKWWVESADAQAEFEQAQIDRAVEKFEAEQRDDVAEKQRVVSNEQSQ